MPPKKPPADAGGDEEAAADAAKAKLANEHLKALDRCLFEERINQLERENANYCKDTKKLREQLTQQQADEADIYYYLHKKLDDNYDVIAGLEKQILTEQTDRERAERNNQKAKEETAAANAKVVEDLTAQLTTAHQELVTLKEFQEKKDQLERQFEDLNSKLKAEKDSHKDIVSQLERRNVQEKEKLKKEMVIKIKETKQNLLSMTEDQLHETTKRTIMENERMTTELQYQSKETEKLLAKNNEMEKDKLKLRRELQISRETEQELAKRTQFYQKLIKKLHEKLKNKDDAAQAREDDDMQAAGRMESVTEANQEVISALQDKSAQLELNMEDVCAELEATRADLGSIKEERNRMLGLQDETVRFLLTSMQDVSEQLGGGGGGGGGMGGGNNASAAPGGFDELTPVQRQRVLRLLLSKLYHFQTSLKDRPMHAGASKGLPPISKGPLAATGAEKALLTRMSPRTSPRDQARDQLSISDIKFQ